MLIVFYVPFLVGTTKLHHYFSMEIVGRFPTDNEATEYEIATTTPVWLPTREECDQFTEVVKSQLIMLREAIITEH